LISNGIIDNQALGLIETRGLVAAILACDTMLKTAGVRLINRHVTSPAMVTILICGEIAAVQAAVAAGSRVASKVGLVLATHVIPRPANGVLEIAGFTFSESGDPEISVLSAKTASIPVPALADLESMPVRKLRALARKTPGFPLAGRRISLANKEDLLKYLRDCLKV
jgi:microcompartment protein CcmL/EutN